MDNLRGFELGDSFLDNIAPEYVSYDDDEDGMDLPPSFGDERRMQVRAYNYWTGLLGESSFPSIEDLHPETIDDFKEYSVLLDFTSGIDNPAIAYLGDALRVECEIEGELGYLDDVPARSLLSRITDHYLQIIANRAPIGFEAEFVNQHGATIMYRGILLPFSSDDDTIDFIFGVINWKEAASQTVQSELELEMAQALNPETDDATPTPIVWADGPSADFSTENMPVAGSYARTPEQHDMAADIRDLDMQMEDLLAEPDETSGLGDWLHAARLTAEDAVAADARSRNALYRAIGRAYDVSIIAEREAEEYAMLLSDAGLTVQERAPMTPIVKLVFGIHYDKTRITEFATALGYAQRIGLGIGQLAPLLETHEGGLKAIVAQERALRRDAQKSDAKIPAHRDPRERLRRAPARSLEEFAGAGDEFVLLVARRNDDGQIELVGSIQADPAFTEKALHKTVV